MIDSEEFVLLVDDDDQAVGTAGKLEAHRHGLRHRALSVVIRDPRGRLLLQKRAIGKYHSGGLWTNTCCSHPRPQEPVERAAQRRLLEEMGFSCELLPLLRVPYRADVGGGMIEDEIVHVFAGVYDGPLRPDPREAEGYAWVEPGELREEMQRMPARFSVWFRKYIIDHWTTLTGDPVWAQLRGEAEASRGPDTPA
ncbi:Isopentenyl-diphosphate Delta-isomerase [bacterium HR40]|nr:Isopentenyl-diphosphate Delta-isomerase [bacterium HR40]